MKLLIVFGGMSSEHEVSCVSAASILRNVDRKKYEILAVGITRAGRWLLYENADPDKVASGAWEQEALVPAVVSPDRLVHGLMIQRADGVSCCRVDCVFPVLHGAFGEDGTIQGLFELSGIPYVGPGVLASANAMDKSLTKIIAQDAGVRQAAYYLALRPDFVRDPDTVIAAAIAALKTFPVFVKPCSSGSSVGVSKAGDAAQLRAGLEEAFRWDTKVLVEEFIDGREIEVAVLGNSTPQASIAGEIVPMQEFYTYDAKYNDDSSELYIPARVSADAMETVREMAVRVYTAMCCRGLSRVDFFCTHADNEIVFNEINTLPGFTSISMYPKLFQHGGLSYPALIDALVDCAMEEHHG